MRNEKLVKLFSALRTGVPLVFQFIAQATYRNKLGSLLVGRWTLDCGEANMARTLRKLTDLWTMMVTSNAPFTLATAYLAALIMQRVSRSVGR